MRVAVRGQEEQVFESEDGDTFAAEISHFVDCLTTGNRPLNTEVEGIGVLGIILAALRILPHQEGRRRTLSVGRRSDTGASQEHRT